jgi:hypothetical protein
LFCFCGVSNITWGCFRCLPLSWFSVSIFPGWGRATRTLGFRLSVSGGALPSFVSPPFLSPIRPFQCDSGGGGFARTGLFVPRGLVHGSDWPRFMFVGRETSSFYVLSRSHCDVLTTTGGVSEFLAFYARMLQLEH